MNEIIIKRDSNKFYISKADKKLSTGIMTGGFFYEKTTFYLPENTTVVMAEYKKKRLPFSTDKRSLFIAADNSMNFIESRGSCYVMLWRGYEFSICYKLLGFDGFYLNGSKIGTIEIEKISTGEYCKKAVFTQEGEMLKTEEYLVFMYLYIVIDYFDVN